MTRGPSLTLLIASGLLTSPATAQVPGATRDLGSPEEQFQVKPPAGLQLGAPPAADGDLQGLQTLELKRFVFSGSIVVPVDELEAVVAGWTGRRVSADELRAALAAVTAHLRARGLYAAQATLPPQNAGDGQVRVEIVEGRLGKVDMQQPANARLKPQVAQGFLSPLKPGTPIARGHLDTPLLLLNDLPGVRVEPTLTPGAVPGSAGLDVKVSDERLVGGFVRIDNHEIRELGEVQLTGHLRLRNPLGIGDLATIEATRTHTGGKMHGGASYSAPVNYSGTRFGVQFSRHQYHLGGDFEPLRANGDFRRYTVFATHPLVRMDDRNLAAFMSLNDVAYSDRIDAVGAAIQSRHRYVTARLSGDRFDTLLGGGQSAFYVEYQTGTVRLDPPPQAMADAATLESAGHFGRARIHLERNQTITRRSAVFASATAQFASKNLALGREILLSGPDAVRAYPAGEFIVDEGYLGRLEYRYLLPDTLGWRATAAVFVDAARGRTNKHPLPGPSANTRDLWGYGASLNAVHRRNLHAQLIFAWRGAEAPLTDPGRNPRIWFAVTQYF